MRSDSGKFDFVMLFAAAALATEFLISGNTLMWIGIPYTAEGGPLFAKLHPGTYLCFAALMARMMRGLQPADTVRHLLHRAPGLALFFASIMLCVLYASAVTGAGGLVALLDSFLPAAFLAAALIDAAPAQLHALGGMIMALLMLNAVVGLAEAVAGVHFVPLAGDIPEFAADFRPTGLYDHPLTAATATMMGVFVTRGAVRGAVGRAIYQLVLVLSLLAYGGRVAFGLTLLAVGFLIGRQVLRSAITRRINVPILLASVGILITLGLAAAVAVAAGVGGRLIAHLYWDPSAQSRIQEFQILQRLDTSQLLFGTRRADLIAMIEPLRLSSGVDVIENFWLLMLCTLGAVCFPVFAIGFLAFLAFLYKSADLRGRIMVITLLLAASCSNSLGRKSTLLVMMVGCVAVSGGGWRTLHVEKPAIMRRRASGQALA